MAVAVALGLIVVAGTMTSDSEGPAVHEERALLLEMMEPELDSDDGPLGLFDYSNCASMIGCYEPGGLEMSAWERAKLEMVGRGEELVESASNCVGFCFNAVVESVDEENWRVARVTMIRENGKRTPAVVERTSISSSSRNAAAGGQPVRFACYDRVPGKDDLRFESCSQMAVPE